MSFLGNVFTGIGKFANTLISPTASVIGTLATNKSQERVANQNIAFQKEMNQIQMDREDNAVERRVLDLQRAGLSKTLAAGSPASASPLTAPKNEYVPESVAKALSKLNFLDKINESRSLKALADKNEAEVEKIDSETTKNNISTAGMQQSYKFEKDMHNKKLDLLDAQIGFTNTQNELASIEGEYRAKKLAAEVSNIVSNTKLTDKNIELKAEEIATEIARRYNLNKSSQKLLLDMVIQVYNLDYSMRLGTPYGQQPAGKLGNFLSALNSYSSQISDIANNIFSGSLESLYGEPDFDYFSYL